MGYILPIVLLGISSLNYLTAGLTYDGALQKTLIESYLIQSSLNEIEGREGERIQSGLFLNPIFSYSVENVFGNRNWKGWESAESRYEIAQPIQINGQRQCESNIACYRLQAAQFRHSYLELKVANALKIAYLDVCRAQELLNLAVEQKATSTEVNEAVRAKSENGKVSALEIKKSMLGLANSELALQKAHMNLEISREKLASFWCGSCGDFDCLDFPYYEFDCPPSLEECISDNCHHPLLLKTQFDQLSAEEEVRLEKAQRFPNLIVTAGYKTLNNPRNSGNNTGSNKSNNGMVLGIAFPLNIFDRNQGNVCRSEAEHCRAFNQYLDVQIALQTRLSGLHKQVMQSYSELMQIKSIILKLADEAYQMTLDGYNAGKFEYLDLLDAQKTLFEAKERYIEALSQFFKKQTDIEYLTIQDL